MLASLVGQLVAQRAGERGNLLFHFGIAVTSDSRKHGGNRAHLGYELLRVTVEAGVKEVEQFNAYFLSCSRLKQSRSDI